MTPLRRQEGPCLASRFERNDNGLAIDLRVGRRFGALLRLLRIRLWRCERRDDRDEVDRIGRYADDLGIIRQDRADNPDVQDDRSCQKAGMAILLVEIPERSGRSRDMHNILLSGAMPQADTLTVAMICCYTRSPSDLCC